MSLRMRTATAEDIPAIGRISAAAFDPSTDSITRRLFPRDAGDTKIAPWREARKGASLKSERTVMIVVVDEQLNDEVVGFSFWEAPVNDGRGEPVHLHPKEPEPPAGLDLAAYQEMRSIVGGDAVDTFGKDGTAHIWHLEYIGVDPRHQRRGIGKILLNWGIEQAQRQEVDCYMFATPAGRALYEKAGFVVRKVVPVFGVPHYSMILHHKPKTQLPPSPASDKTN
uniref:N-acetyltransferase domain-containing protein n=1 Tax=Bionectria ochroleuca TaxID=29856 RepID=A0A8H7KBB6_BIOOC